MTLDLAPAAQRMADLITRLPDEALAGPTPCPAYTLGDLVEHVGGLAVAFTTAARKGHAGRPSQAPSGDASRLGDGWRARIAADLAVLADAWTGMTEAGGIQLPGDIAGLVALDELVVHGWDVARSSGQPYEVDEASLGAVHGFVASFGDGPERGPFGPAVATSADAPRLDQVVGLAGRDPAWRP